MDTIKELLNTLGITDYPEISNNSCTVFLRDSDVYEKIFERLEKIDNLTQDDVQVTDEQNVVTYYNDNIYVELNAMFDEDLYTLKIDKIDYDYEKEGE